MKNTIFICSNVSNANTEPLPLHIYHQVRCSAGTDNNLDLDRTLVITDGGDYDHRRISGNTTQVQCKEFLVPEIRHLEGRDNQCYATTRTWVVDERNSEIKGYATSSPVFNITSDTLNIPADWERISNYTFNTIINLSATRYSDWNGMGTGNIDVVIDSTRGEVLDPRSTRSLPSISLESLFLSNQIKSITAINGTGGTISDALEYLEDGKVEIELRNVDLSQNGYYNLSLTFHSFEERQTETLENSTGQLSRSATALEGIENKTGTFHLSVDCPTQADSGSNITCLISAQVEDSQLVEKEVDFTCYLSDGVTNYNSLNFNQMVNRTLFTVNKTIFVPSTFSEAQSYVFQCEAGYYNLGSRTDYFYDSFVISTSDGSSSSGDSGSSGSASDGSGVAPITGGVIGIGPFDDDENEGISFSPFDDFHPLSDKSDGIMLGGIIGLIIISFAYLLIGHHRGTGTRYGESKSGAETFLRVVSTVVIFLAVMIVLLLAVFYGASLLLKGLSGTGATEISGGGFWNLLILIGFVTLMIIILFKALNVRAEIKIGHDSSNFHSYEDKKHFKMQNKLNRMILKKEIEREKGRVLDKNHSKKISAEEFSRVLDRAEKRLD